MDEKLNKVTSQTKENYNLDKNETNKTLYVLMESFNVIRKTLNNDKNKEH